MNKVPDQKTNQAKVNRPKVNRPIARKYRPQKFSEVVGQPHVVRTIGNALARQNISHAYLFSGPRGVGKTTVARILAKVLNCQNSEKDARPCGECSSCQEIIKGASYLYKEIDGASHRGIDQMREIQMELQYAKGDKSWKIYVIDEVHMLTTEAFNAMLKSLEEPPERVLFVLCTTESHRVPETIISRTQHFRFRLVPIKEMIGVLTSILKKENISFEKGAVTLIAKKGRGSIRDAENIAEQVIAFCSRDKEEGAGIHLSEKDALEALNMLATQTLADFFSNLKRGKLQENLLMMDDFLNRGGTFSDFLYELIRFVSNLIHLNVGIKDVNVLNASDEEILLQKKVLPDFLEEDLYKIIDIAFEFIQELRFTKDPEILSNLFLFKLHRYKNLVTSEEIRTNLVEIAKFVKPAPEEKTASLPGQAKPSSDPRFTTGIKGEARKGAPHTREEAQDEAHNDVNKHNSTYKDSVGELKDNGNVGADGINSNHSRQGMKLSKTPEQARIEKRLQRVEHPDAMKSADENTSPVTDKQSTTDRPKKSEQKDGFTKEEEEAIREVFGS